MASLDSYNTNAATAASHSRSAAFPRLKTITDIQEQPLLFPLLRLARRHATDIGTSRRRRWRHWIGSRYALQHAHIASSREDAVTSERLRRPLRTSAAFPEDILGHLLRRAPTKCEGALQALSSSSTRFLIVDAIHCRAGNSSRTLSRWCNTAFSISAGWVEQFAKACLLACRRLCARS